jgi:hypothetical protein
MNYDDYLLEHLNRNIAYTEYVAESVNKNIDYVNYLNKQFNINQISIKRKEKISKIFRKSDD